MAKSQAEFESELEALRLSTNAGLTSRVVELYKEMPINKHKALEVIIARFDNSQTELCDDICRTIAPLLAEAAGTDMLLCETSCRAVKTIILQGNSKLQTLLGECGACEMVVDALELFGREARVVEQASLAMAQLCIANVQNKNRLEQYGACLALHSVLKHAINTSGQFAAVASCAICWAIAALAQRNPNAVKMFKQLNVDPLLEASPQTEWKQPALLAVRSVSMLNF